MVMVNESTTQVLIALLVDETDGKKHNIDKHLSSQK
jgi:hypothetical protein